MNTHNSKGELNNSLESNIAHTKFMLKVARSTIDASKLEIHDRINTAIRELEKGANPDDAHIQSIYSEANVARIKELNKRQAINEFEHAQNRMQVCAIASKIANEALSVTMSKLVTLCGLEEASRIIDKTSTQDPPPDTKPSKKIITK